MSDNYVGDTNVFIGHNYTMCIQMLIVVDNVPGVNNVSDQIIADNNHLCFSVLLCLPGFSCVF